MSDEDSKPPAWYRSWPVLVAASILLPPVGLALVWTRRDFDLPLKAVASVLLVALGAGYLYFIYGEDHDAALERHRAQQRQSAPAGVADAQTPGAQATAADAPQAATVVDPAAQAAAANGAGAQPPVAVEQPAAAQGASAPNAQGARRNYWTNFRGPGRDGRHTEAALKSNLGAGLPLLWRQPVGGGYASFVVADGAAFTIEQRRGQEVVTAYSIENGRELWAHGWDARFRESTGDGPRATPTWDAGRLYALGGTGELRCLDARTGRALWSKNILTDNGASNLTWGMAAAPLVVDEKVIVQPGGSSGKSVVAYNKMTGAPVWKVLGDEASYTSPMLVTLAGRRQILAVTARRVVGLAPEDGSLLWEHPWSNSSGINVAQPIVVTPNRFFISAGYGKGASLVEVASAGKGLAARSVWENNFMKNKFNSSVFHEGHVYGLDEGIMTCMDVSTGERKWKGGRYGYGQVVLVGGILVVTTEEGEVVFLKPTPAQHTEVARFNALSGKTWNVPAVADGRLLVRNETEMACYKLTD
ncbi:MAG TPA: PQQ-binding-like beta-propeller repeat protein [Pyrinomonadaceae bacterium]|nr:PQQ-binding-like beta-propeller repeat protein [Pyrinomonadaceae bacterium]